MLAFSPPLVQLAIAAIPHAVCCPNIAAFGKWLLLYHAQGVVSKSVSPPNLPLLSRGGNGGRRMDGSRQEDAQEFVQLLLETFNAELVAFEKSARGHTDEASADGRTGAAAAPKKKKGRQNENDGTVADAMRGWKTVRGRETLEVREHEDREGSSALLASVFGGKMESQVRGVTKSRNGVSAVVTPFYTIPVDVAFATTCTIEQALARSMEPEKILDEEHNRYLTKSGTLSALPLLLCVHVRRWAVTAEGEVVKLDNQITLEPTLTLPAKICDNDVPAKARSYRLLSVISHRGAATGYGHYVTYLVQNVADPTNTSVAASTRQNQQSPSAVNAVQNGAVVLCNDTRISVVHFSELHKEHSYFLMYQKV